MPTGEPLTAHAALSLFATAKTGAEPFDPVDVVFEGSVAGDSTKPLGIDQGWITVARVKTRLLGTVTFSGGGIRVEVEHPTADGAAAPPFVLDTHEWLAPADAAATVKPAPAAASSASAASPAATASAKPPKSGGASKHH